MINPDAVVNISRSGKTFTMTKADGSTAQFTQQDNNTNYYHNPLFTSGVEIGSGTGGLSADLYVPEATATQKGVTIVYPANQCTTFTSDTGTVTPAAVKKAVETFAVLNTGDNVSGNLTFSNPDASVQKDHPHLIWNTINSNTPKIGYATDQTDGTFIVASIKGTSYTDGLAIGGGSGNLLWKGKRVLTVDDAYVHPTHTAKSSGFYKITVNSLGHVSATTAVTKADITALGIPGKASTVSLNGTSTTTASFYAPTGAGTNKYLLKSNGSGAPTWTNSIDIDTVSAKTINRNGLELTRIFSTLIPYGTQITASSTSTVDLNTATYMKVGNYFCSANAEAKYITNLPKADTAFMMQVLSPLSTTIDNENGTWVYRLRIIRFYTGEEFTQYCYTSGTGGNWSYGSWIRTVSSDMDASSTAKGLMSAADKAKLDGIAAGANKFTYTLPTAGSSLGGVKTTSTVTSTRGLTACPIINGVVYYKDTNTHAVTSVNGATGAVTVKYIYGNNNYTLRLNDNTTNRTGSIAIKDTSDKNVWILRNTTTAGELIYEWYNSSGSWLGSGTLIHSNNYTSYCATAGHTHSYAGSSSAGGAANSANWLNTNSALTYGASGLNYFNASLGTTASASSNYAPTADWYHIIRMNHSNAQGYYVDLAACFHSDDLYIKRVAAGTNHGYKHIWIEGNSVTSAVWNDYAEYRESDCAEFGRVLAENGDDTLSATTERLQHFAGISSDTWGFCQGETEKAKTPIAVAGRVLAYTYRDRDEYKPGDCLCAAPNGTVDIMTREEVMMYPDRIVGTVSCIPDYEEWGQGDRPAVKVDGRIWVKVK